MRMQPLEMCSEIAILMQIKDDTGATSFVANISQALVWLAGFSGSTLCVSSKRGLTQSLSQHVQPASIITQHRLLSRDNVMKDDNRVTCCYFL